MTNTKKYNIIYNIEDSNFSVKYDEFIFYFTSETVMNRFKERVESYCMQQKTLFYSKYNINLNLSEVLFAISLYKKMERRGFKVYAENFGKYINDIDFFVNANVELN